MTDNVKAKQVDRDEVLSAAVSGRLHYVNDQHGLCWYVIDDVHITLNPVQQMIGEGQLALEMPRSVRQTRTKVVVRAGSPGR